MRGSLGEILLQQGVIDSATLADALGRQGGRHPIASTLYTLGYASERELATALSKQTGWPAIVLDESAIRLEGLAHINFEWARVFEALVVSETETSLVIAAARPDDTIAAARELAAQHGKRAEMCIALDVTLARTIRTAFRKAKVGELFLVGPEVDRPGAFLATVSADGEDLEHQRARRALAEDALPSVADDDFPQIDVVRATSPSAAPADWLAAHTTSTDVRRDLIELEDNDGEERTMFLTAEIDRGDDAAAAPASADELRALVVDHEPGSRIQLVSELERAGYHCQAASTGAQAIDLLSGAPFDLVFADVSMPDIDGLRVCRAIKRSRRLTRTLVVVTANVVDSGQVPEEVLQRYGTDGYLEKPIDSRRLQRVLHDITPRDRDAERVDHDAKVADALARYHDGDLEGAITKLRTSIADDHSSPKLHFMLANMLQRASHWAEAIDEYEAVVELQPTYFPALTRLAYLYFRQGMHARAVETWRRALPVCEDPALRRNIELFMRKLVADLSRQDAAT